MKVPGLFAFLLVTAPALGAQHPLSYRPGFDVINYDLALDLPEKGSVIRGRATLDIARTAKSDALVLDLIGMRVDSVLVGSRPVPFTRDSAGVRMGMPAFTRPDTVQVTVVYGGEPSDGLIIRTDSLGRWTGFGDNWPTRARYWIPSIDDPSDKATVTWSVTAPAARKIVSNGVLLEENPQATRLRDGSVRARTVWRESRPIPTYLMVIGAGALAYYDLGPSACGLTEIGGCVRQSVYFAPEQRSRVPGPFVKADEIVSFFSSLVAPFPYEKLAHVQSSTKFGGMENAGAIFYSDKQFREGTLRAGLVAHEVAHQWFGDAVTPHRWADLWLSEGFASYFEQVWVQRFENDSAFRANMRRIRGEIIASPAVAARPVVDSAERNLMDLLNENSYQKGAWTLHMLRGVVGDSAFFRGVRSYYNAHRHSTATTDDLRRAVEKESGQDLVWFFRQWVERPGFAELSTSWQYNSQTKRVELRIRQGERFGPYRFPLSVDVRTRAGVQRVVVNVPAQRDVTLTLPTTFAERPQELVIDPDVAVLATFRP